MSENKLNDGGFVPHSSTDEEMKQPEPNSAQTVSTGLHLYSSSSSSSSFVPPHLLQPEINTMLSAGSCLRDLRTPENDT